MDNIRESPLPGQQKKNQSVVKDVLLHNHDDDEVSLSTCTVRHYLAIDRNR